MKVHGIVRVPGDKSITHRALLLGALARGRSFVGGALTSLDAQVQCARAAPAWGGDLVRSAPKPWSRSRVEDACGAREKVLDCGNSGTTTRLLLGMLAGHRFAATLTGDGSLRRRPMRRVTVPLTEMGARVTAVGRRWTAAHDSRRVPASAATSAGVERPDQELPAARRRHGPGGDVRCASRSAARATTPNASLRAFGYRIDETADGWIEFAPDGPDRAVCPAGAGRSVIRSVPGRRGDAGRGRRAARFRGVGVNPTRIGFLPCSGAWVRTRASSTLPTSSVSRSVTSSSGPGTLAATEVTAGEIPGLIDEIPLLAVVASRARGHDDLS